MRWQWRWQRPVAEPSDTERNVAATLLSVVLVAALFTPWVTNGAVLESWTWPWAAIVLGSTFGLAFVIRGGIAILLPIPILVLAFILDPDKNWHLPIMVGIYGIPTTFVAAATGYIVARYAGSARHSITLALTVLAGLVLVAGVASAALLGPDLSASNQAQLPLDNYALAPCGPQSEPPFTSLMEQLADSPKARVTYVEYLADGVEETRSISIEELAARQREAMQFEYRSFTNPKPKHAKKRRCIKLRIAAIDEALGATSSSAG